MLANVVGRFTQTAGLNCQLSLEALKLRLIFMDFHRFWWISISCYKLLANGKALLYQECIFLNTPPGCQPWSPVWISSSPRLAADEVAMNWFLLFQLPI